VTSRDATGASEISSAAGTMIARLKTLAFRNAFA
jgi:hypothetical protein